MSEQDFGAECAKIREALDGLWGVCDSLYGICADVPDSKDSRLIAAGEALCKAQEAIEKLQARRQPAPEPKQAREHTWLESPGDVPCIGFIPTCGYCGTHADSPDSNQPCPCAPTEPAQPAPEPVADEWPVDVVSDLIEGSVEIEPGDLRRICSAHNAALRHANAELSRCRVALQRIAGDQEFSHSVDGKFIRKVWYVEEAKRALTPAPEVYSHE